MGDIENCIKNGTTPVACQYQDILVECSWTFWYSTTFIFSFLMPATFWVIYKLNHILERRNYEIIIGFNLLLLFQYAVYSIWIWGPKCTYNINLQNLDEIYDLDHIVRTINFINVFIFFLVVLKMVNFWDKLYHHEVTVVLCTTDDDIDDNDLYQIQYSQNRAEWKLEANELFKKRVILIYLFTIIFENLVFLLQYYT